MSHRSGAPPGGTGEPVPVLVVGAGPAGSSLALRLARAGVRTLLLDAARFPRSKPCGDCLSPGAEPLLSELGVRSRVEAAGATRLRGWRLRSPDGTWFEGRFRNGDAGRRRRGPATGLALPRRDLDAVLLRAAQDAGARLRERLRVFELLRVRDRVVGVRARAASGREVRLRARVVVGADGLRSAVARRLEGVRRGRRRRLALVGRFRDVERTAARRAVAPDGGSGPGPGPLAGAGAGASAHAPVGTMRLSREGCLGVAPTGSGSWNATLVVPSDRAAEMSDGLPAFYFGRLRRYGLSEPFGPDRLAGEIQVTGPFEVRPRRISAPGALLVGDAAGYLDPFTGQGVYRALLSARLAAPAVVRMLRAREPSRRRAARQRYEDGLARALGFSRSVQRLVDAVVSRPGLMNPAARLLAGLPGLASLLVDVTGDRLPAGALADPRRLWRVLP